MPNERGRIHEYKALVSPCERREFRISTWSLFSGLRLVLKHATHSIRFSSAGTGSYQTALHYCGRPLLDWGDLPVFFVRPHAPNREVCTVTVRYEYMYRATPNSYSQIMR